MDKDKAKYEIFPMKDNTESYKKKKDEYLFNMPFKLGIIGKSELAGKTTLLANLLLLYYKGDFEPEDIYIVSPSALSDNKWKLIIKVLDVPSSNIWTSFNEDKLMALYDVVKENYEQALEDKEKPKHSLIIFDDVGYSGDLKSAQSGIISLLACNGRHFLISTICICQKYTQLSTTFRENATGLILFSCSDKQLDLIMDDHMVSDNKKAFKKAFRESTNERHGFFVINYSNDADKRYLNKFDSHFLL